MPSLLYTISLLPSSSFHLSSLLIFLSFPVVRSIFSLFPLSVGRFLRQTWLAFETADTLVQQRAVSELVAFVRTNCVLDEVLDEAGGTAPTLILATGPFSTDAVLDLRSRPLTAPELAAEWYDRHSSVSLVSPCSRS